MITKLKQKIEEAKKMAEESTNFADIKVFTDAVFYFEQAVDNLERAEELLKEAIINAKAGDNFWDKYFEENEADYAVEENEYENGPDFEKGV